MAPTANGANTVAVNTGGGLVDGKPYHNTASVDVNVPSAAGAGNTRIDRIVLRAGWAAQTVRITRLAGVDAASPAAPSISQISGTTYDVMLCRVLVNTSGAVTVTDERVYGQGGTNSIADAAITAAKLAAAVAAMLVTNGDSHNHVGGDGAQIDHVNLASKGTNTHAQIDSHVAAASAHGASGNVVGLTTADGRYAPIAKGVTNGDAHDHAGGDGAQIPTGGIANDAIDDTKVGDRVPALIRRQGGNSASWITPGTTSYTPAAVRMQTGAGVWNGGLASQGSFTVTFPVAFSQPPLVFATLWGAVSAAKVCISVDGISASQATLHWAALDGYQYTGLTVFWLAIGPEA
jgi:hypothetical protein